MSVTCVNRAWQTDNSCTTPVYRTDGNPYVRCRTDVGLRRMLRFLKVS
jgi:hypothetical protein